MIREMQRHLRLKAKTLPETLTPVPRNEWPKPMGNKPLFEVWRSKTLLVQGYTELNGILRLSICRTQIDGRGMWLDGLTWDDLQRVKRECGFGDREAVEVYPADEDVVNVANLRHLWLLPEPLTFSWRRLRSEPRSSEFSIPYSTPNSENNPSCQSR